MRLTAVFVIAILVSEAAFARGAVRVRGYTTKSGKYVAPHYRSAPDRSRFNNWSTIGNVNPYTGRVGTQNPYGAPYRYRSIPSYGYSSRSYGYTPSYVPSSPYSTPRYTPRAYSYAPQEYRVVTSVRRPQSPNSEPSPAYQAAREAIELPSGVVMVPADTKSGYCLQTPPDYVGTGSINYPSVTEAIPRCEAA